MWEFEFRQNLRKQPHLMFELRLQLFPMAGAVEAGAIACHFES